jgi:hypothetical protein
MAMAMGEVFGPIVLAAAAMLGIALVAAYPSAHRAARVEPVAKLVCAIPTTIPVGHGGPAGDNEPCRG